MPGGFEADDALWAALSECEDRDEMTAVMQAWLDANTAYWADARPSPAGWTAPRGCRPARDWSPPDGMRARLDRMPWWARFGYHAPWIDRRVREWMWHHGGYDVLPPS
jgi:hypothetical protein